MIGLMADFDFTLKMAVDRLGLTLSPLANLFAEIEPLPLPESLRLILDRWASQARQVNTEKARSELIISPILMEAAYLAGESLAVYSGVTFDVDRERGLFGRCDYLIGWQRGPYLLGSPIMAVVEAKNEDIPGNLGQCVSEMVAAQLLNDREGRPTPIIHGCVTTGTEWVFLQLKNQTVTFDEGEKTLADVGRILAYFARLSRPADRPGGP